uniref:Uncharacterized protein n=1 Tax=Pseudomonas putida (strain W619) TaxID=390235 RepID=B1JF78_PSEPW
MVALGMFAAAALQLQALQATDSARRDMQNALGAHTLLERGRAAGKLKVPRP